IAIAGFTAAGISLTNAFATGIVDANLGEPTVIALLAVWVTLSYVVGGVIAWRRRPASHLGPLMIAAGFANFASTLVWSSTALLIDAFAVALVMIAFLFVSAAYGGPWVAQIRWGTFVALALAPSVFLLGLFHARLARSAVGDLVVELRADLPPSDLRDALARA